MGLAVIRQFIDFQEKLNEYEYLISTIEYFTAPTMEGRKPSSLVTFTKNRRNIYCRWEENKDRVYDQLGINYFELGRTEKYITVLFYNAVLLDAYINAKRNISFLEEYGYKKYADIMENLNHLKNRFDHECPHEIGIFLGIPLDDVTGFIDNEGRNFLMSGYWKVYSSTKRAKAYFKLYDSSRMHIVSDILTDFDNI